MPIANPSPYRPTPSRPLSCSRFTPFSLSVSRVLHRLLHHLLLPPPPPPPTSLLHSIRPLLAARTRVSGEPPPLNHHACDRHVHRDIAISCVNHTANHPRRRTIPAATACVVSSPVIAVCDAANLYYAARRRRGSFYTCESIPCDYTQRESARGSLLSAGRSAANDVLVGRVIIRGIFHFSLSSDEIPVVSCRIK